VSAISFPTVKARLSSGSVLSRARAGRSVQLKAQAFTRSSCKISQQHFIKCANRCISSMDHAPVPGLCVCDAAMATGRPIGFQPVLRHVSHVPVPKCEINVHSGDRLARSHRYTRNFRSTLAEARLHVSVCPETRCTGADASASPACLVAPRHPHGFC
jgi:predicted oxidoreductase